jgi:hypothetical protein
MPSRASPSAYAPNIDVPKVSFGVMDDKSENTKLSGKSSDLVIEQDTIHGEALSETRRYLDAQFEMAEDTDKEILTILRLNLLSLGGVVTLIAYVPSLVTEALPWIIVSGIFLISSILLSAYIYRGIGIYSSFGDHGYDKFTPDEKIPYDAIVNNSESSQENINYCSSENITSINEFRKNLLQEHQAGITHNNFELKYRNRIQQHVTVLLLFGIIILGTGIMNSLLSSSNVLTQLSIQGLTILIAVSGGYVLIGSVRLLSKYILVDIDENRMSYDYAFEWSESYLTKLFKIINNI